MESMKFSISKLINWKNNEPTTLDHWIYDSVTHVQWEENDNFLNKWYWVNFMPNGKRKNLDPYLIPYI